jgi:hypothetical protein
VPHKRYWLLPTFSCLSPGHADNTEGGFGDGRIPVQTSPSSGPPLCLAFPHATPTMPEAEWRGRWVSKRKSFAGPPSSSAHITGGIPVVDAYPSCHPSPAVG